MKIENVKCTKTHRRYSKTCRWKQRAHHRSDL